MTLRNFLFTIKGIPHSGWVQMKVRAKNANGHSEYGRIAGPFQALEPVRLLKRTAHEMKIIWQTIPAKEVLCFEVRMERNRNVALTASIPWQK